MVNKKLSPKDEDDIYMEWISGKSLAAIATNYPVVISTIQRVIKRKSNADGSKKNCLMTAVFKHIKNVNEPLELALKMFADNDEPIHEKQKDFLLESIEKISNNLNILVDLMNKVTKT